jgi:hypothetical protein
MNVMSHAGSKSATGLLCSFPSFPSGGAVNGTNFPFGDHVTHFLRDVGFFRFYYTDEVIQRRTSYAIPAGRYDVRDYTTGPRQLAYSKDLDLHLYGNTITGAIRRFSKNYAGFNEEHGVIHTAVRGLARHASSLASTRLSVGSHSWDLGGGPLPGFLYDGLTTSVNNLLIRLDNAGVSPRTTVSGTISRPKGLVADCTEPFLKQMETGFPAWNPPSASLYYLNSYTDVSVDEEELTGNWRISYTLDQWVGGGLLTQANKTSYAGYHNIYGVIHTVDLGDYSSPTLPFAVGNYSISQPASREIETQLQHLLSERQVGGSWIANPLDPDGLRTHFSGSRYQIAVPPSEEKPTLISSLGLSPYNPDRLIPIDVHNFMDKGLNNTPICAAFETRVSAFLSDIRTVAPLSSSEALNTLLQVIETNHLETLAEAKDIAGLLKPLEILKRWAGIAKGKPASLKQMLDDLTSLKLLYSFMIEPSWKAAHELQDKIEEVRERFTGGGIPVSVAHGSITKTVDLGEPFTSVRLVAHSKLVGSLGAESFLANMLGVKAAGLFPSLSSFWDVVPLSFIADWGLNLDDRLELMDNQMFALAFDWCYAVHSFSLEWTVPPYVLELYNLVADPEVTLRTYVREKSAYYPSLRESVFDWHSPSLPSDMGMVGSVVFQLTK